jgi:hypothetical protein
MPAKRTKVDRVVQKAAATISQAITEMIADLPVGSAPTMVLEQLVEELADLEAWQLIMEDRDIQDAYYSAKGAGRAGRRKRPPV